MYISHFNWDNEVIVVLGKYLYLVPDSIELDSVFARRVSKKSRLQNYVLARDSKGCKLRVFTDQDFYKLGKQLAKR